MAHVRFLVVKTASYVLLLCKGVFKGARKKQFCRMGNIGMSLIYIWRHWSISATVSAFLSQGMLAAATNNPYFMVKVRN